MWPRVEGLRAFSFGDAGPMRQRLTALALAGTKVATAGLLSEGFESVEDWRSGHTAYYAAQGIPIDSDSQFVCVWFRIVEYRPAVG